MTREERIRQLKACGQSIIDNAEQIYGEFECPSSLEVFICMEPNGFPKITVKREYHEDMMISIYAKTISDKK